MKRKNDERERLRRTYVGFQKFCFTIERVDDLPGGEDGDIDGEQDTNDHEELVVFNGFLIEFDIGENGVDTPSFGEHGTKGEREAGHQCPNTRRADDGQSRFTR